MLRFKQWLSRAVAASFLVALLLGSVGSHVSAVTDLGTNTLLGTEIGAGIASGEVSVTRDMPLTVEQGETFEVTVTFTAPEDAFNAIALSDEAGEAAHMRAALDASGCEPDANASKATDNKAEYIWFGPYDAGKAFTATYEVIVDPDTPEGTYSFSGWIGYYISQTGPHRVDIGGPCSTIQVITPVSPPPGGGGGGGGGGDTTPPGPELEVDMMGRVASGPITEDGELEETMNVTSRDGVVTLRLPEGTVALDSEGNRLEKITVEEVLEPPALPENWHVIGVTHDFGPDGATFDLPIGLTICCDPEDLPEGVNEEDLVIAFYHSDSEKWRLLEPSVVDTGGHTVTGSIGHLTVFAVIGREEAAFDCVNLLISPSTADTGESVTISVEVTNSGGMQGSYVVTLQIGGVEEATHELTLGPGANDTVIFTVTKENAGTYEATVDGLSGSFTVTADQLPWWVVGLGAGLGALLLAAITAYVLIWRRRRATA